MPSHTDGEHFAAAEYRGPHSVLNSQIHAACHRKLMHNIMMQMNTTVPTDLKNLINATYQRKQMQNTLLQLNTMVPTLS